MVAIVAAVVALAVIARAQDANTTTTITTTTTATTTTTLPHVCAANNPCGTKSACMPIGEGHVCRCLATFSGVDSADGEGCFRNSIMTAGAQSATGRQGMLLTVGEGADVYVQAGGAMRGETTSVLQQARDLKTLLGDGLTPGLVADNTQAIADLEAELSEQLRQVSDSLQDMVNTEANKATQGIQANAQAILANAQAIAANTQAVQATAAASKADNAALQTLLLAGISAEANRASAKETALKVRPPPSLRGMHPSLPATIPLQSHNHYQYPHHDGFSYY